MVGLVVIVSATALAVWEIFRAHQFYPGPFLVLGLKEELGQPD